MRRNNPVLAFLANFANWRSKTNFFCSRFRTKTTK